MYVQKQLGGLDVHATMMMKQTSGLYVKVHYIQ